MLCVRPGVFDVLARLFLTRSELMRDDFPTFDRPRKDTSGRMSAGHCKLVNELFINSADTIFMD